MAGLIQRGSVYHLQWYDGPTKRRKSLKTDSLQVAKERLRQFESARFRGEDCPLPTKTPVGEVVAAYLDHMKAHRPERSWRKDITHIREAFGPCCAGLELTSSRARRCRELRCPEDARKRLWPLQAASLEEITTAQVGDWIAERVRVRGLAPKTANRYREVIAKVFNWAIETERVRLDRNPAAKVARYREGAWTIRYLTLPQIDEQLAALAGKPTLRALVAVYIYAGLRREEALWLTHEDVDLGAGPNGMIRVRAKTVGGESWQPKTGVNRAVPISRDLRRILEVYRPRASGAGWYFPSPQSQRWDRDNASRSMAAAQKRAGLAWTCLDYRHTFGSQLAQKGVSLFKIATLMGNSPEICRRHYAALVPEGMGEDVEFCTMKNL